MNQNKPIRVLCVFSTLDRGGAESMCMNLYRHINRHKIQFDFVKHTHDIGAFEEEIMQLGGIIYEAPRLKTNSIIKYCRWWRKHLLDHPEHQIIHGHFFGISPVYFKIAKMMGRKTVGHIHISKPDRPAKAIMARFISRTTDYPLACSQAAGKWVYRNRPFIVLNNGIDTEEFRANIKIAKDVRNELSLGNALILGNVSRFNLQKNPFGTLEIFRLVHERRSNSKLLWVGDGPMRAEVQERAKEYGIQDDVIFTGVRSDVERLLQAMDAFVFPSFYEGLGIAAVEAQAAGVPTYCSSEVPREAGVTELCHFLPLNDLEAWAKAIEQLPAGEEHPNMYDQIVKAGYDIHETANWLQEFYLSIDSKKRTSGEPR